MFPAAPLLMVIPLLLMNVSPAVMLSRPFRALARRTFRLLLPSDTTPRLSSVVSLLSSVMPPTTFTCSFSFFLMTAPVSPPYFMPSSSVATSCFFPFSSRTRRVTLVPSTAGLASPLFIVSPLAPLAPFKPMEPSLPLIATAEPSLPLTPMEPFLPAAPVLPTVSSSFSFKL